MIRRTFEFENEDELLAAEWAIAMVRELNALADGAKWIWNQVARSLPGTAGVLDFHHAGEHVCAAAHALHGQRTAAARGWAERCKRIPLESGAGCWRRITRRRRPRS